MDIRAQTIRVLQELEPVEAIEEEMLLMEELGLDSLSMVTLLILLEDAFQIAFREEDMNPFGLRTAGDVIRLVEAYLEEAE